jgi:hypothetical protein
MQTGFFSDASTQYYTSPQQLNSDGLIQGHQHAVIQNLGDGAQALDAREFDFFKGLNEIADGSGSLSVTVPAGTLKTDGVYRLCSITGTFTHQPVIMPVAKRGAQDDCIRFEAVSDSQGEDDQEESGNDGDSDKVVDNESSQEGSDESSVVSNALKACFEALNSLKALIPV